MAHQRGWMQRVRAAAEDLVALRAGWAENRRLVREPVQLLYVRCDGCGEVTSHLSVQRVGTITWTSSVVAPPEVVCDVCRHPQPRTVGDEVTSDVDVLCRGFRFRRWRTGRGRRRCGRIFRAPGSAARPRCQWCLSIQPGQS